MRLSDDVRIKLECYEISNRTEIFSHFKKLNCPAMQPLFEIKIF